MNHQSTNLCLILVFVAAWIGDLMGGSFFVAPQENNSLAHQEVYPLGLRATGRKTV
jgi:hypothetical protein